MGKKNIEREIALIRKFGGNGYLTYRHGSAKPVTLARVFTGQRRQHMVSKTMNALRDWRLSHFEREGPTVAGLRSGLCMDGYEWKVADNEARELVAEGLHLLGAKRPAWAAGQPEYVIGREHCANCRGPLDDAAIASRHRFCCKECKTAMQTYRNDRYWYAASEAHKWAYEVAKKDAIPVRSCAWCETEFKPNRPDTETCQPSCAARLREHRAGRLLGDRQCKNPACGKAFRPESHRVQYCCQRCHIEHQQVKLGPKPCENPACGKLFNPRFPFEKFCGGKCRNEAKATRLPAKPCGHCGEPFVPKERRNMFCSKSCASKARAAKAKCNFTCEEVTGWKEAVE